MEILIAIGSLFGISGASFSIPKVRKAVIAFFRSLLELQPNGGESMKDKVDDNHDRLLVVVTKVEDMADDVKMIKYHLIGEYLGEKD